MVLYLSKHDAFPGCKRLHLENKSSTETVPDLHFGVLPGVSVRRVGWVWYPDS